MRLGGPLFDDYSSPFEWVEAVKRQAYSAAYAPVGADADADLVRAYAEAAIEAKIVIAEVGAWGNNPVSPDRTVRQRGIEGCCRQLDFADRLGALCCVNVSGGRGAKWDGPHPQNLTEDTFDLIVASVREIIDTVGPLRTSYALETMPWMYPDGPQSYVRLVEAIDREHFGVHLDPVNLISSPARYYASGAIIEECFSLLGPHIRSCHAKDVLLDDTLTVHLSEVRPGLGNLDYRTYVRELERLGGDTPLMMEHLNSSDDYRIAAAHIRNMAQAEGVPVL